MNLWAAIPAIGYEKEFIRELEYRSLKPVLRFESFYLFEGDRKSLFWSQVEWSDVQKRKIESIGNAAKLLKNEAKIWEYYSLNENGRGNLIHDQLSKFKFRAMNEKLPSLGVYTLVSKEELLFTKNYNRIDPLGRFFSVEDERSPSTARNKLYEAVQVFEIAEIKEKKILELGAYPGGWTKALLGLGANVIAVDRAELGVEFKKYKFLDFRKGDAFKFTPDVVGEIDILFSDLICYPEKLLDFVRLWQESGLVKEMLCTIKLKGECDFAILDKFAKFGMIRHLYSNKHELSWYWSAKSFS
ncbi:MAG: hypothetical protein M9962_03785 [Oligoflexia bacterium]|nr:hypothetical protein [Oligoflexia bacterium]